MEHCYIAIVLRKREMGETDRLYTMYTQESGKIQVMARGVRRSQAKLAGHLETLNRSSVTVARGRGLGTITSAVAEWYGERIKENGDVLLEVADALVIFERIVGLGERDQELFRLLCEFLETAEKLAEQREHCKIRVLSQAFLFQAISRLGYQVETMRSVATGERLRPGQRYVFSFDAGGVMEAEQASVFRQSVPIRENTIKFLRIFLAQPLRLIPKVRADEGVSREISQVLRGLLGWIG